VSSDVLLIGLADRELVSRLGEFCLSLLKLDTMFLAEILPLMYRMAELRHQDTNSDAAGGMMDEDEGVTCRANPLSRLLIQTINVLAGTGVVQSKRNVHMTKLLSELRQPLGEVVESFFRAADSHSTDAAGVVSVATSTVVNDMLHSVQQDCHFEPQTSIQQLPVFPAFMLGLMMKKPTTAKLFVSELELVCKSSVIDNVEGFASCVYIVNAVIAEKLCPNAAIKRCIVELQQRNENLCIASDTPEVSPNRILLRSAQSLLLTCCSRVGIPADATASTVSCQPPTDG
jgi:hypothetical protein